MSQPHKPHRFSLRLAPLALALLFAQGSWAQPAPNPSAGTLQRNSAADRAVPGLDAAPAHTGAANTLPRELGKPEDDIQLDVKAYQIDGLPNTSPETLAALAATTTPYVGKDRHYEDLSNAVAAVTLYVQRNLGYYVGMAYLPEQKLADGVVHIAVLEGRLDEVKIHWPNDPAADPPVKHSVIEGYLSALKPGSALMVNDVERVVFLVNDLPGVRTRFEIEPGRAPGTASLVVTPQAESRVSGSLGFDTLGSRYTGITRWNARVGVASPLGLGDSLVVHALTTTSTGLYDGGVSYVVPVGANGLKLGASVSGVSYGLEDDFFDNDPHGSALAVNTFGTYPLVRSRNLNVFGLASYEYKSFDDINDVYSTRKSSNDVLIGVVGDFRDSLLTGAVNTYEANWLQGRMSFDPAHTPDGLKPSFGKLGLGYSRLQNVIAGSLQFYGRYKGQLANANLDSTERMSIGGDTGVRAFGPGEGTADEAHVLTAELRWLPPDAWFGRAAHEMSVNLFYDWGHAKYMHDPVDTVERNTATLAAVGFGVIWQRPADFTLRFDLAWRAQGQPYMEPASHMPRAGIVLTKLY